MEKASPNRRRSRYKTLSKTKRSPLVLQERDIDIARLVHEHYQLNSHHIRALVRGLNVPNGRTQWNEKKITERLPQLCDHGIIKKIKSGYELTNALHRPDCYQLGLTGEKILRQRGLLNESTHRIVAKNREGQYASLPHRIMINDVWVSIQLAVQADPDLELIRPTDIIRAAPEATRRKDNPFEMPSHARYRHPRSGKEHSLPTGIVPDKLFGIQNNATGRQLFIMLEVHRTVPLTDASPNRKTVLKTLAAYRRMNAKLPGSSTAPIYQQHFGIPNMLVLWATTSDQKVANILALVDHLTEGNGSALFGAGCLPMHQNQLRSPKPATEILEYKWQRCRREGACILQLLENSIVNSKSR
jgi:Replication-relaxation